MLMVAPGCVAANSSAVEEDQPEPEKTVQPEKSGLPDISIRLEKIAGGLFEPVNVAVPPGDNDRIFIVDRPGRIQIVKNGELQVKLFLDIRDRVESGFGEQGLLDLVFHPDFQNNGFFYINFSDIHSGGSTVIARFSVDPNDPEIANPDSFKSIITFDQPRANHNGGELEFGPDGCLYIGTGDGGGGGDPFQSGQNLQTYLGKILRIDIDTPDNVPYSIPPDNPFVDNPDAFDEIWAWGLRNPWKFTFDIDTGDLYIADVGQNTYEEIDFQPAGSPGGENYGWNMMEGFHCFPISDDPCDTFGTLPIFEYDHRLGCSVTGFGVYRGDEYPDLNGVYFFGDFCSGRIWGLNRDDSGEWIATELLQQNIQFTGACTDHNGDLYVVTFGDPALWKIVGT
jgi:glucose/arabinose dehydrogenase